MNTTSSARSDFIGLAATFALFFVAAGAPTPLLALQQQQWGFGPGTLTFAFSVYALGLLGALLVGGSLSDHIGRRPVLLVALYGELLSIAVFVVAPSITWVIVARAIQGLATGVATSAFSAAIVEAAPARLRVLAGGLAAASVAGGLGIGALLTGAAVEWLDNANTIVFVVLGIAFTASTAFVHVTRETGASRPGAWASLAPTLSLPGAVRYEFIGAVPGLVGAWMTPAFFLGLAPTILRLHFDLSGGLVSGFTAFLGPFVAAVAGFWFAKRAPRWGTRVGAMLVAAGMALVLVGVLTHLVPLVWLGAVAGGFGFGGTFGGTIRLIAPAIQPHERAATFASLYTVAYLAFGVPVIAAGQLAPHLGLVTTVEIYTATVIVLGVAAALVQAVRADSTSPVNAAQAK
jgi:MFS family permease